MTDSVHPDDRPVFDDGLEYVLHRRYVPSPVIAEHDDRATHSGYFSYTARNLFARNRIGSHATAIRYVRRTQPMWSPHGRST